MISTLIINYHCADLTCKAVASVLREENDAEVIVVDNSEEAAELSILKKLLPSETILLSSGCNEGFAKACNRAYSHSKGDMILLLNPDAELLPGALARMKTTLIQYPKAGAVGPRSYWNKDKKFLLPPNIIPSPWYGLMEKVGRYNPVLEKMLSLPLRRQAYQYWRSNKPFRQPALSGGHMLLSRNAVEQSGGLFDERFFMYFEDTDLVLRLRQAGYNLYLEPRAECIHHYQHSTNKMKLMADSAPLFYQKHFRNSLLTRFTNLLPPHCSDLKNTISLGKVLEPPHFEIPFSSNTQWLFELGLSTSFVPSIGYFGSGHVASISHDCWALLHPGRYYAQISALSTWKRQKICWTWEIPELESTDR